MTWDDFLKRLGLDLDAERRKKLMGVLNVERASRSKFAPWM